MKKKQQFGFGHLALVLIVIVLAIIGLAGYQVVKHNKDNGRSAFSFGGGNGSYTTHDYALAGGGGASSTKDLPACTSSTLLDHMPLSNLGTIEGLGHMYGEHILPVQADHIYLYPPSGNTATVNAYAPGNVTLIQLVVAKHIGGEAAAGTDYTPYFSPCKSILFSYGHLNNPSAKLLDAMKNATPKCASGSLVSNCTYENLSVKLTSGELIGTTRGGLYGLDFSAVDVRTPQLNFINKKDITGGTLGDSYYHTVCGLDYFTNSVKAQLYGKLVTKNAGANGIPECGTVMQDKPGTSQGNWYRPGLTNTSIGNGLDKIMALVHSNLDATQAVLSAGGDLLPTTDYGAQITYTPMPSGYINPDPSRIKPDGHVYCIEGHTTVSNVDGHVDLQMTDASNLKTDFSSGSCAATPVLSANTVGWIR